VRKMQMFEDYTENNKNVIKDLKFLFKVGLWLSLVKVKKMQVKFDLIIIMGIVKRHRTIIYT